MNYFQASAARGSGELHIYGAIGTWAEDGVKPAEVAEAVSTLSARGAKSLEVFINSPGGSAFDGIAIYNAIRRFTGKKVVHVDGLAASAASVIAMAGDEIRVPAGAQIMIHPPHGMGIGGSSDMRKLADELDGVRASMVDIYAKRTKAKRSDIEAWVDAETWMDGKTAVARGFATHVDMADSKGGDEHRKIAASTRSRIAATWRAPPAAVAERWLGPQIAAQFTGRKAAPVASGRRAPPRGMDAETIRLITWGMP